MTNAPLPHAAEARAVLPGMADPRHLRSVGILGVYGTGNLGNEASVAAIIQHLQTRCPGAAIYVLSLNPADTRVRHKVTALPAEPLEPKSDRSSTRPAAPAEPSLGHRLKGRLKAFPRLYSVLRELWNAPHVLQAICREVGFLCASWGTLRRTDLLIVGGGGVLSDDFGGPWDLPLYIFKWSLLAKLTRTPVALVSVGAGPLDSPLARFLVRRSLALAGYQSFRDLRSKQLMDEIRAPGEHLVFPDVAYSLRIRPERQRIRSSVPGRTVALNLFPHHDPRYWHDASPSLYQDYLTTLSGFTEWLLENGYTVSLFPTQIRADARVIHDLLQHLPRSAAHRAAQRLLLPQIASVEDLTDHLAGADLVVATRFHGLLISFLLGKPVLALVNHPKMEDLMADMGQSPFTLNLTGLGPDSVIEKFRALEADTPAVMALIRKKVAEYRGALDLQFDRILARRIGVPPSQRERALRPAFPDSQSASSAAYRLAPPRDTP